MTAPTQPLPTLGQPNSTEDSKVRSVLSELQTILTTAGGGVDTSNLADSLATYLGVNTVSTRRGKSIIVTTETRNNVAYGLMPTPDRVQNIVLPTDGKIFASYQATWQESFAGAGRAAFFLGANQQRVAHAEGSGPTASSVTQAATTTGGTANTDHVLASAPFGLASYSVAAAYGGDVTTGQAVGQTTNASTGVGAEFGGVVSNLLPGGAYPAFVYAGGVCEMFAAAGTYDISVQFKASSGTVTAKNRKLWVWTMGF